MRRIGQGITLWLRKSERRFSNSSLESRGPVRVFRADRNPDTACRPGECAGLLLQSSVLGDALVPATIQKILNTVNLSELNGLRRAGVTYVYLRRVLDRVGCFDALSDVDRDDHPIRVEGSWITLMAGVNAR